MAIRHVYSQTVADGTATSVVRPSDWNSAHNQTLFIAGNTAGASSISGSDIYWAGGSNVTLSANGSTVSVIGVAAQTVDTNKAGTGFTSTTTAGTAVTAALGTNGLSMAVPQYITTYVNDLTSGRAGTGFTSTSTTGVLLTAAQGTNGLSMAVPNFITTYVNDLTSGRAGTGFTSTTTAGTAVTAALGTNGLSMAVPNFITTYVNDLTSGRAGTGFTSTTTAGSVVTAALGTNGLSMAVPNFITTYINDLTSGRAGTGSTTAGTNISMTLGVNTNGVALSANVADVDYNAWNLVGNTAGTTGTTVTTQGALYFSGGNNVTLSGNSNTIVISAAAGGAGGTTNQTGPNIAVAGSTITSGTVLFSNSNGVTFGMNGSTLTASIIANNTYDGWPPYADLEMVAGQQGQGTLYFEPEHSPYYFQDRVGIPIVYTNNSGSNGTLTLSYWVGFYTQNVSTLSLASSTSISTAFTFQGTTGTHWSLFSGMRILTIPWTLTVAEQEIYIGQLSRTSTGGNNASISQMLVSQVNSNFVGFFGQSHNTTQQWTQGQGVYTVTTSGLPSSVAFSQIRGSDSLAFRAPAIMFINGTV
jgi:hypothetical protein